MPDQSLQSRLTLGPIRGNITMLHNQLTPLKPKGKQKKIISIHDSFLWIRIRLNSEILFTALEAGNTYYESLAKYRSQLAETPQILISS